MARGTLVLGQVLPAVKSAATQRQALARHAGVIERGSELGNPRSKDAKVFGLRVRNPWLDHEHRYCHAV